MSIVHSMSKNFNILHLIYKERILNEIFWQTFLNLAIYTFLRADHNFLCRTNTPIETLGLLKLKVPLFWVAHPSNERSNCESCDMYQPITVQVFYHRTWWDVFDLGGSALRVQTGSAWLKKITLFKMIKETFKCNIIVSTKYETNTVCSTVAT